MTRVGKVKVFTEEGKMIRHGPAREEDFRKKIFGLFSPAELIRSSGGLLVICFLAGGLWATNQNHFQALDRDIEQFTKTFSGYKQEQMNFHHVMFDRMDAKDKRIDCIAEGLTRCCREASIC